MCFAMSSLQAMLSAGVDPLTVKTVSGFNTAIFLEYLVLQYVDKLHGDANFPIQLDLALRLGDCAIPSSIGDGMSHIAFYF